MEKVTKIIRPALLFHAGEFQENVEIHLDGAGRIEKIQKVGQSSGQGEILLLPHHALLPGVVNAHSHAFQRLLRGRGQRRSPSGKDHFWSWRENMYRIVANLSPEDLYTASAFAFMEMLKSGITTVGEFHYVHHQPDGRPYEDPHELAAQVLRAGADTGIRMVLLLVAYTRAGHGKPLHPIQRRFCDGSIEGYWHRLGGIGNLLGPQQMVGVAPHSIRAVPREWLREMARLNRKNRYPVHMHLHEQPLEIEECQGEYGMTPIAVVAESGLMDHDFTAVHATHLADSDRHLLAEKKAIVCACPSTERDLGDGILDAGSLLERQIPVCFGTDSQTLIDPWEDARELEYHLRLKTLARNVLAADPSVALFQGLTQDGARALGISAGHLEEGALADCLAIHLRHPSLVGATRETLLAQVIFSMSPAAVSHVFVAGQEIVHDGHHPLEERLSQAFHQLSSRISPTCV